MVTKDELFSTQGTGTALAGTYQKSTKEWVENSESSQQESSNESDNKAENSGNGTPGQQQTQQTTQPPSYAELFKQLNPQLTEEQKKEIAKKEKNKRIIAAITDGVGALSNLYFATKGAPNTFDGRNTLSERNQIRYDKMMKDRKANEEAYRQGLMKAEQMDRELKYKMERDNKSDEHNDRMYQLGVDKFNHEKSRADQAQTNWQAQFDYTKERNDVLDGRYNAEQKAKATATAQAQANADRDYSLKEKELDAKMQGDYYSFIGDNNSPVYVHKDRLLTDDVFEQLVGENVGIKEREHPQAYKNRMEGMSKLEKKAFIAENWSKSDIVRRYAMANAYNSGNSNKSEDKVMPGVKTNQNNKKMPGVE